MTRQTIHTKKAELPKAGAICLSLFLFFCFALLLRRADVATSCMREGLALCVRAIVPSLFPFMVLSELLVATGTGECLTSPLARPLGKLLDLSPAGCSAVVLGLLCGFPVGARCAITSFEKGRMEREECERVLACSSIPSSAFLISTVGSTLWKNIRFGIFLYVCAVFSAILSGFLLHVVQKRRKSTREIPFSKSHIIPHFKAEMLSSAIKNTTTSTLLVCAYVVFFATLGGAFEIVLERFSASETMHAIVASLLELSGGVSAASMISNQKLAKILTGATVGWSGISVHCQMLSLCDGHNLSTRQYVIAKLAQAVICAIAMCAALSLDIFY